MVARANRQLRPHTDLTAQELVGFFDLSGSVSSRADTMLGAMGLSSWPGRDRWDAALLASPQRARILELRERYSES